MYPTIAEYNQTIQKNGGNAFVTLKNLTFIPSRTVPVKIFNYGTGSYAVIFKAQDAFNTYAIRCFLTVEPETVERYREISDYLKNIRASWLVNFSFFEREINVNGQYYPVLKMDWINGKLLNSYINEVLQNNIALSTLQREIVAISRSLERNQIGHGDIQCGNMIVQTDAANKPVIKLIDYDGLYIPAFKGKVNLEKGRSEFQHPQRTTAVFNEKIDRFSFWVILCALEALKFDKSLWLEVMQGGYNTLDNMLFVGNDFTNFNDSKLVNRLYALNQPSLSFYLNKLRQFCNSSFALVEAPLLYNSSIIKIDEAKPFEYEKRVENPAIEEKVEMVDIVSNPAGAAVLTTEFKRLGATPLHIDKQKYLNQKLLVTYGTEIKQIQVGENDNIVNVSFSQKSSPPEPMCYNTTAMPPIPPIPPAPPVTAKKGWRKLLIVVELIIAGIILVILMIYILLKLNHL